MHEDEREEERESGYGEPETMAAARERLHALARELPRDHAPRFEEETRARIEGRYAPADAHDDVDDQGETGEEAYWEPETALRNEGYAPESYGGGAAPETEHYRGGAATPSYDRDEAYDQGSYEPAGEYAVPPGRAGRPRASAYPADDSGARELPEPAAAPYDNEAYETSYPGVDRRALEARREPSLRGRGGYAEAAARRDESQNRRREEEARDYHEEASPEPQPTRREDSSARHVEEVAGSPEMKVPANFVVGVQPIRQPAALAPATPSFAHAPIEPPPQAAMLAQPPAHGTMAASPRAMHAGQQPMVAQATATPGTSAPPPGVMPVPTAPLAQQPVMSPAAVAAAAAMMAAAAQAQAQAAGQRAVSPTNRNPFTGPPPPRATATTAQPVGQPVPPPEVDEGAQSSKVGRFAWFVFGAAFGIFFAFFATGFVPRIGKKDEIVFPPAASAATAATAAPQPVLGAAPGAPAGALPPGLVAPAAPPPGILVPATSTVPGTVPVGGALPPLAPLGTAAYAPAPTTAGLPPGAILPGTVGTAPSTMATAPAMAAPTMTAPAYATAMPAAPTAAPGPTYVAPPQPAPTYAPAATPRAPTPRPQRGPVRRPARGNDDAKSGGDGAGDLLNAGLGN